MLANGKQPCFRVGFRTRPVLSSARLWSKDSPMPDEAATMIAFFMVLPISSTGFPMVCVREARCKGSSVWADADLAREHR